MNIKKHIPNLFTLGNLFSGTVGIIFLLVTAKTGDSGASNGGWWFAPGAWGVAACMAFAMFLDFFDGFLARALGVAGDLGKQLDSLADGVTFGVLPGLLMFDMMSRNLIFQEWMGQGFWVWLFLVPPLFIVLMSIMRLGKFNIDERQGDTFYGLPTPANAFMVLSLFLMFHLDSGMVGASFIDLLVNSGAASGAEVSGFFGILFHPITLVGISFLFSWLLVADIKLIALKFKNYSFADNKFRYVLIGSSVILLATLLYRAVPVIIFLYFALSIIQNQIEKRKTA